MKVFPFKNDCPSWIIKYVLDFKEFKLISTELRRQGILEKWTKISVPNDHESGNGDVIEMNQEFVQIAESLGFGHMFKLDGKFIAVELEENYDLLLAVLTHKW